ncbi:MAG: VCBS repeat-containing protein, partial [Gemmatimonadaceae bacterium]
LEYSYPNNTPYTGTLHVFKNDGGVLRDSTSRVMSSTVIPDHPRDFEIRDFTGDGVLDLYVAQHGFDAPPFPGAPNLFFTKSGIQLAQVAATRFANFSSAAFSHGSSSADVDCDGDIDLVELNVTPTIPNILWLNGGTGNFTAATSKAPAIAGTNTGQRWQEPSFIDIDNDGDPDMYLGARSGTGWNEDVLLVNDGFGNFRATTAIRLPAPKFPTAHGINNAKAADFNGDGRQDLVLFEIPQPFSTSSAIRLWINKGNGSFSDDAVAWGLPSTCTGEIIEPLYVADFNSDGWPDVAIPGGCPNLGGPGLLINKAGTFQYFAFKSLISFLEFDVVTPMDINGDGKLDLFFGDRGGNPVIVKRP